MANEENVIDEVSETQEDLTLFHIDTLHIEIARFRERVFVNHKKFTID
jgi:hypothetical protein